MGGRDGGQVGGKPATHAEFALAAPQIEFLEGVGSWVSADAEHGDGFGYDPAWSQLPKQVAVWDPLLKTGRHGPYQASLARVDINVPLASEFSIFIVYGWDVTGPRMHLTTSAQGARYLLGKLGAGKIFEVSNKSLWSAIAEDLIEQRPRGAQNDA